MPNDHWCTPPDLVDDLLAFLELRAKRPGDGPATFIGLDPCSNAMSIVPARERWDIAEGVDGLKLPWGGHGPVWVNFPYSKALLWANKLAGEAFNGVEILTTCHTRLETQWFRAIRTSFDRIVMLDRRIAFVDPDKKGRTQPREGSFVAYAGPYVEAFDRFWSALGWVVRGGTGMPRERPPGRAASVFSHV